MIDIKKILENRNNRIMLVILIIGIAIIVISSGVSEKNPDTVQMVTQYCGEEEQLSEILSQIEGVGRVSVMISYVSTVEKDIACEGDYGRAVTSGGDVVVKREVFPQVKGVIVTADGAEIPRVKQAIKEAVIAVTGAGANRVCVFPKKK